MATSQNGYKANDDSLIASYVVVRDVKLALRKGDVSVVLLHFARWFDANIQKLRKEDTGGYAKRTIRGSSTTLSNHASGTAEDLCWNDHPLGKVGTFTAAQAKKIRAQLKFYDGVIRWGGDYSGRKDEMHFEINKGLDAVKKVADKIRAEQNPKPATPPKAPSKSTDVDVTKLPRLEVDGVFGGDTILRWQQVMKHGSPSRTMDYDFTYGLQWFLKTRVDHRLSTDGKFGPETIRAVQRYLKSPVDGVISKPRSNMVVALQRRLNQNTF